MVIKPRKTRSDRSRVGRSGASARFELVMAIIRENYDLTPAMLAEVEAIVRKLDNEDRNEQR